MLSPSDQPHTASGIGLMQAAVISGPGTVSQQDVPMPEPSPGQVRIRIEGCGVCGSSLPLWEGRPWFDYPLAPGAPGHESWGLVDALGPGVEQLAIGERVAALGERGYAEYDIVPIDGVVRLAGALSGHPFPGEPLGCAVNAFRRSCVNRGDTVVVIGIGFLGALLVQLASGAGARVIAVSRRPFALEVARQCGADLAVTLDDPAEVERQVLRLTGEAGADRVIEAVGLQATLDLAARLTRVRGRLVIAGYHQDSPRQVDMQLWNWRGLDVVNAHERDPLVYADGMREAARLVATGGLAPERLYTHLFSLDETDRAFEAMRTRPDGFLKALVLV